MHDPGIRDRRLVGDGRADDSEQRRVRRRRRRARGADASPTTAIGRVEIGRTLEQRQVQTGALLPGRVGGEQLHRTR